MSAPAAPRHGGGEAPTPRAQPFYCPYCGEEEVRPAGEGAGEFHCSACERRFDLRFLGVGR